MNSILFYRSYYDAISILEDKAQLEMYRAILRYGLDGVMPQFEGVEQAIFMAFKPTLDLNRDKCEKREEAKRKARADQNRCDL